MSRNNKAKIEQADGPSGKRHTKLKTLKHRHERRKAKNNPECDAGYKKYRGYEI